MIFIWSLMILSGLTGRMGTCDTALAASAKVDIELSEYETGESGENRPYENDKIVLPGQWISKQVVITNKELPSWIRVKVELVSEDELSGLSEELLKLWDENLWEKRDEYYYFLRPAEQGENIRFLESLRIPAFWDSCDSGKQFRVIITAEAIQEETELTDSGHSGSGAGHSGSDSGQSGSDGRRSDQEKAWSGQTPVVAVTDLSVSGPRSVPEPVQQILHHLPKLGQEKTWSCLALAMSGSAAGLLIIRGREKKIGKRKKEEPCE